MAAPTNPLHAALDRLAAAVDRLDQAASNRPAPTAADAFEVHALETALAEARAGEATAKARVAEVGGRLDKTIGQLRLILEE